MSISKNATIIDVRSPEEFAGQHFSGAINIPLPEVANRIDEFRKMEKPIVAYCRSGSRSGLAVAILKQNGIAEAENGGGLDHMLQAKSINNV